MNTPWPPTIRTRPAWAWACLILLWWTGISQGSEFRSVSGPCGFSFPRDHGSHPGYQTEWWYYTGHLESDEGRPFGFQLTFFRRAIVPPEAVRSWPSQPSAWRTENLFMAHAAVSDIARQRFYWDEDLVRGAAGLAGVYERDTIRVFLGRWEVEITASGHRLRAFTNTFSFDLAAIPRKAPTAHGEGGYSRKGIHPESASCYYSISRLHVSGSLWVNGKAYRVQGTAWMDHEYSSAPLEPSLTGWDWFSLQFADQTELMIYLLREKDGSPARASSGTFIPPTGAPIHLPREDFEVLFMDRWRSPHTKAQYPSRWRIRVPSLRMDVELAPRLKDQELRLSRSMRASYWEGGVTVRGQKAGRSITGLGYVEMTGYDVPFNLLGPEPR